MAPETNISTWFVSDDTDVATYFPQLGARSDRPDAQLSYWRCIACFFASSVRVNRRASHTLYTNVPELPSVDGLDIGELFSDLKVRTVFLPITFRLPRGSVHSWGNQFYILDIIKDQAINGPHRREIVLDSDCVWVKPVDRIEQALDVNGVLTYELGPEAYALTDSINGLTRAGMGRFLARLAAVGPAHPIPYFGGEIFAATKDEIKKLASQIDRIWQACIEMSDDSPKEEAHLLSILYALNGYAAGTANPFIKRMWTAFKHNNLSPSDLELTIWHLPAEKRTGFRRAYAMVAERGTQTLTPGALARVMGVPRRNVDKLVCDLSAKARQYAGRVIARL